MKWVGDMEKDLKETNFKRWWQKALDREEWECVVKYGKFSQRAMELRSKFHFAIHIHEHSLFLLLTAYGTETFGSL